MTKKIYGYWHVWCVNHYAEIVREQLEKIVESGLYDASEYIFIGCLGHNEELRTLLEIIKPYPKIVIRDFSTNNNLYEFETLSILKEDVDASREDHYVFYIHTKGVSFPEQSNPVAFNGGNYWRRFMDKYILTGWKECVELLDFGYEMCGTQLRPHREWKQHFSGNTWFGKSEYLKLCPTIHSLNLNDRFLAETWCCMAHPIAATLSQEFIDYYNPKQKYVSNGDFDWSDEDNNASGVYVSHGFGDLPQLSERKPRTVVHTLCWALYSDIEKAVDSLFRLNDAGGFEYILVGLNFPLLKADEVPDDIDGAIKENARLLKELANKYGGKYVEIPNEGVSQNWTSIFKNEKIMDGDILIGCEPDEMVNPQCYGWVDKMVRVLRGNEKIAVVSLMMEEQFAELNTNNSEEILVDGVRAIVVHGNSMWPAIGISGDFLFKIGGIPYLKDHAVYGFLEQACLNAMGQLGYEWAFLPDVIIKHPEADTSHLLRLWKNDLIFGDYQGAKQIPFIEWLRIKSIEKNKPTT